MAIAMQFDVFTRSLLPRAAAIFMFVCTLLGLSAAPVLASYEWCSRDPVITFTRQAVSGQPLPLPNVVDVQVMTPIDSMSVGDVATLTVMLPSNVAYTSVDTSTPLFQLDTAFRPVLDAVTSDSYRVRLSAFVPAAVGDYPVRLMMTNSTGGLPITCEGRTGQSVRATVQFAPFGVACQ